MKQQLKGSIPYLITIEGNNVTTDYGSSPENDIAAIAITQKILSSEIEFFKAQRDKITGLRPEEKKARKFFGSLVNTMRDGVKGTSRILGDLLDSYEGYKAEKLKQEEAKAEKEAEIVEFLKEKGVTVESGTMNEEEVKMLLADRKEESELRVLRDKNTDEV